MRRVADEFVLTAHFVWSDDGRLVGGARIPDGGLLTAFKGQHTYHYRGDLLRESEVRQWVRYQQFEAYTKIDVFSFDSIINGDRPVLLCNCQEVEDLSTVQATRTRLRHYAHQQSHQDGYIGDLVVGELEEGGFPVLQQYYQRRFGRASFVDDHGQRQCKVLLYDPRTRLQAWKFPGGERFTAEKVERIVEAMRSGTIQVHAGWMISCFEAYIVVWE